jgi:hypothetical protein
VAALSAPESHPVRHHHLLIGARALDSCRGAEEGALRGWFVCLNWGVGALEVYSGDVEEIAEGGACGPCPRHESGEKKCGCGGVPKRTVRLTVGGEPFDLGGEPKLGDQG